MTRTSPTNRHGFLRHVLPAILYCALLFVLSSMTAPPAPSYGFEWGDKINHAGAYFLLMLLAWRAVRWLAPGRSNRWHLLAALAFVAFYGATDELHQAFVPGRDCDLFDWLADVTGGVPGLLSIQARGRLAFARAKEREG